MLHADWSRFSWINDFWRKRLRHSKVACGATRLISVFWLNKGELGSLSVTKNCGKTRSRGFEKALELEPWDVSLVNAYSWVRRQANLKDDAQGKIPKNN